MRKTSRFLSITASTLVLAGLAACSSPPMYSQPPAASYPAATYPAASYPASSYPVQNQPNNNVAYGRVSNVEVLRTQEPGKSGGLGAVLGGVAGAIVGHQIGNGGGRDAATVVGAVGGAVAGNAIEKNRSANANVRETYRVSVQLDNGAVRAYDVPSYGELRIGDRVKVENNQLYRIM